MEVHSVCAQVFSKEMHSWYRNSEGITDRARNKLLNMRRTLLLKSRQRIRPRAVSVASVRRACALLNTENAAILGLNVYCVLEMNDGQRQSTPILCDTTKFQWHVLFQFDFANLERDTLKCSILTRSKYTPDRKWDRTSNDWRADLWWHSGLLGSISIAVSQLMEMHTLVDESLSTYSSVTSHLSEISGFHWRQRSFDLQQASMDSRLSMKYSLLLNVWFSNDQISLLCSCEMLIRWHVWLRKMIVLFVVPV
jgi:hypothetical protein